MLEWRTRS